MITFSKVTYSRSAEPLISDLDLTIFRDEKIGIVGANGCGKSTLFQVILGELSTDSGQFERPTNLRIAHVKQETPNSQQSGLDYVLDGDVFLRRAQAKLVDAENKDDGQKIAEAHAELDAIGAYDAETRAAKLLSGLGFSQQQMEQPVRSLSGGWRVRLNLAQALIQQSDLMLLDEPTNHLDLDAVFWLESFLKNYHGTLLIISHDRDFLDAIVSRVFHFNDKTIKSYRGNYTQFIRIKAEQEALQEKQFEKQQTKIKHLQSFIDRFKAKASKAKQAQSRVKALEKMATVENIQVREKLSFEFFEPKVLPDPLLTFYDLDVGYGDVIILEQLKLSVRSDSRIGLLGRNGAGKSTLLKTLANEEVTVSGKKDVSKHLNVGYFAQHQLEQLNGEISAFQQMQRLDPTLTEQQVRNYLGGFAFHGDQIFNDLKSFSGGEKARVVLALIIYQKPNLLLLDEPTNHLDMDMRDALSMAIQNFNGAVVLISHDRYLLDATVDELYLVDDKKVLPFTGDTHSYYQWLKQNRWQDKTQDSSADLENVEPVIDRKEQKRRDALIRKELSPVRKKIEKVESDVQTYQNKLTEIEAQLSDTTLYSDSRKNDLDKILLDQVTFKQKLEESEMLWFELQEEYEQMKTTIEATYGH